MKKFDHSYIISGAINNLRITKIYIWVVLFVLVCFFSNCSQTLFKSKSEKELYQVDEYGVETGLTKEQLDELKKDYTIKCNKLSFVERAIEHYYFSKVNINLLKEFNKLSYDLKEMTERTYQCYKDEILFSPIIVLGKIKKRYGYPNPDLLYHTRFELEIDEILKGKHLIDKKTNLLYFFTVSGPFSNSDYNGDIHKEILLDKEIEYRIKLYSFEKYYQKDQEVLIFLTKLPYQLQKLNPPTKNPDPFFDTGGYIFNKDIELYDHFQSLLGFHVENNMIFDDFRNIHISIEGIRKDAKIIEELNNTENFYKRSYK